MAQLKKYLIHVIYECPLSAWGKPAKEDEWRVYEANELPRPGQILDNNCGEPFFLEACHDERTYCEEKGKISKVEEFSPERARQLGLLGLEEKVEKL